MSEDYRLKTLALYNIMDSAAERCYDNLTELAASVCGTPISLISLVDDQRQWFKSRHGLDAPETPIDQAFCAHAIQSSEIMIVEDAHADTRFADNPLVTGDPHIRFYAGAPLTMANGAKLGTLCVIDREPRTLSAEQAQALQVLRDAVVNQLELRRALSDINSLNVALSMCAWCRKVPEQDGDDLRWYPLEEYMQRNSNITHGICPDCADHVLLENGANRNGRTKTE